MQKYQRFWRSVIAVTVVIVCAGLMVGSFGLGEARADGLLSFNDWLARQSTRVKDLNGNGLCGEPFVDQYHPGDQYIPADRSYLYLTASGQNRTAVVDYLGISGVYLASHCGVHLGTTTAGTITGHMTQDGRVLVSVRGHTNNALAFVVGDPSNPLSPAPPLFGAREADVCSKKAPASVVDVEYEFQYYYTGADPEHPIVDNQWFGNPPPPANSCATADDPFDFRFIGFRAEGDGLLSDGTRGRLTITQTGTLQSHSHSSNFDGFPAEFIRLQPLGK